MKYNPMTISTGASRRSPLAEPVAQRQHVGTVAQNDDKHHAKHRIGNHPAEGVEKSVKKHSATVSHIARNIAHGCNVGGKRTRVKCHYKTKQNAVNKGN